MTTYEDTLELKGINQKITAAGEELPLVKLRDGSKVQTDTVAAMLHNIKLYNESYTGDIEDELTAAVPTLIKVGLFDLFPPDEWIAGDNAGRRVVGEAALRYMNKDKKKEEKKFVFPRLFMI